MMFALGGILLVSGIFIARPYCRFLCPYGVLLNLVSRVSKRHLTITPAECIKCRLCENSCPFDAIDKPTGQNVKSDNRELVKKLTVYFLITPLLVVLSGWTMSRYHEDFAMVNFKVRLANEIINQGNESTEALSDEVTAFMSSGTTTDALYSEVLSIIGRFKTGSWIIGSFIGLVFGLTLARLTIYKYRNEYVANKGNCFSCARCLDYCPVKARAYNNGCFEIDK
jgi:NAD-dependent dihydropyrimidine dehydrogenase PreA subunit